MKKVILVMVVSLIGLTGTLADFERLGPQEVIIVRPIPEPIPQMEPSKQFKIECPKAPDIDFDKLFPPMKRQYGSQY